MRARALLGTLMMTSLLLAGCASSGKDKAGGGLEQQLDGLDLKATDSTGVIRGVVVDERIVPVAGVNVTLTSLGRSTSSNADGAFGFQGLEPGTYFLSASKDGFKAVQQSVDVVAGRDDPPVTRILLTVDGSYVKPYYETYTLSGFIQCGITTSAIAAAVCSIPNGCNPGIFGVCATNSTYTQDVFNQFIPLTSVPTFIQHELVWDATQSTGDQLSLAVRTATQQEWDQGGYHDDIGGDIIGTSPLVAMVNATMIKDNDIGVNGTGLAPAVFTGGMAGTAPCLPETPATNPGCLFANGATVNQKFDLYTHIFYGYTPPEGWRFSEDNTVPEPPQA